MVMKSRAKAGTIFGKQDGVSRESGDTIFIGEKKHSKHSKRIQADSAQKQNDKNGNGKPPKRFSIKSSKPQEQDQPPQVVELADPPRTLEGIAVNSARTIYRLKTIFPFVLFRDEVIADEEKITVVIGLFFQSGFMRSIMLKDIANVSIDTSILFSSLTIIDRNFVQDPIHVRYLKKEEAFKMRRVVMGLIIADTNKVDLSNYNIQQMREYTEEIGRAREMDDRTI